MINIQHLRWLALCIIVIVSICFAGCSAVLLSPDETPLSATPTFSPIAVLPSSPEPPTRTPTPSPIPATRTPYPTRTPRPTLAPTLTADEERAFVVEMLETNGGCELPCWWGITPGETDWQAVKDQFGLYYGRGNNTQPDGTVYHSGPTYGLSLGRIFDYYIAHTFVEKDGIVQSIEVSSEFLSGSSDQFAQDWARYSLNQILIHHGTPSRIAISPATMEGEYYYLYIFYDELGIGIRYVMGPTLKTDSSIRICFSFVHITLWLQSPEWPFPLQQSIDPLEWSLAVPLEDATGMSVDQFCQTFGQPGNQTCLEVPMDR